MVESAGPLDLCEILIFPIDHACILDFDMELVVVPQWVYEKLNCPGTTFPRNARTINMTKTISTDPNAPPASEMDQTFFASTST